jgi:SynChlorMet cassette protein ScmC
MAIGPPGSERSVAPRVKGNLSLANGCRWTVLAGDRRAKPVVARLIQLMGLRQGSQPGKRMVVESQEGGAQRRLVKGLHEAIADVALVGMLAGSPNPQATGLLARPRDVRCVIGPVHDDETLAMQLRRLSLVFVLYAQDSGALLLHGALAELSGYGVVLSGPSGVGKTTVSRRLPPPWRSLSDDMTLVVRDDEGAYWAHPWPSWGSVAQGEKALTWNVDHAVLLKAMFFLEQAPQDELGGLGRGAALCSLMESVGQATQIMSLGASDDERRAHRLQQFENACALVEALPAYRLRVSARGAFWREMERVIGTSVTASVS